ncbi:uncharacterized protein LOC125375899 [Haliotis rufescens]|uniref:uncharacterized protein LOC125375899 n=1 Tax=Haliotis rufescens TaxID=6454 RepID=UPI00201F0564|nr:uncharacterized protein LOC125375899 [Haliotis rufescens]XP_048242844.1 uncharacterized protein LOC125375899 [Haliotis rufescens]
MANKNKDTDFASEVERLISKESDGRMQVVETLNDLANEVDKEVRKARIAKTTFASTGILGSGLAIGGIIAAPFTFGASLGLTIAGVALGVSSGVGGLVTTIIDRLLNSKKTKAAYAAANKYLNIVDCIVQIMEEIRNEWNAQIEQDFKDKIRNVSDPETTKTLEVFLLSMKATSEFGAAGAKIASTSVALASRTMVASVSRTVANVLKTGTMGLAIGGAALAAITIPVDVYTIYKNSRAIHVNEESAAAKKIRELATDISKERPFALSDDALIMLNQQEAMQGTSLTPNEKTRLLQLQKEQEQKIRNEKERNCRQNEVFLQTLDMMPKDLTHLADMSMQTTAHTTLIKLLICLLELLAVGFIICKIVTTVAHGHISAAMEKMSHIVIVIGGVMGLVAELFSEIYYYNKWKEAVAVVEKYVLAVRTSLGVAEGGHIDANKVRMRKTWTRHSDDISQRKITILRTVKTLIDIIAAISLGTTEWKVIGQRHLVEERGAGFPLGLGGPISTAVALLVDQPDAERVMESFMEIAVGGSLCLVLTSTITFYILVTHWSHKRSCVLSDQIQCLSGKADTELRRFIIPVNKSE